MKRMLSVLLAVSMILTLLPLQIFAAESAGAALEYSIGGVTLYDEEDIVLDEIPEGKFKVGVSIEALEGAGDALMLLAAYTEDGQYQSLLSSAVNKETDAAAFTVDNTAGKIAKLRAFVVRSFETMAPLSAMYAYPSEVANLKIGEAGAKITGGIYQNVTVGEEVCDGDVTLTDLYIRGDLYVKGGGSNTVTIDGCVIEGEIIIDKEVGEQEPRLYLIETPVTNVTATSAAIIEAADDKAVIKTIETSAPLTVQGEATVVDEIIVAGTGEKAVEVIVAQGSKVETLQAKSAITVAGGFGTVDEVVASASVKVASNTVSKVTVAENAAADTAVTVVGSGDVEVVVNAQNIEIVGADANIIISTDLDTPPNVVLNGEELAHIHQFGEPVVKEATCKTDGSKVYTCTSCGETKTEVIEATGHAYGEWKYLNQQEHQRICANDATHVEEGEHNWGEGVVTLEPTETVPGQKTFTCTVCAGTKTEEIPVSGTRQVAAPKGIASIQSSGGMSYKIGMIPPEDLQNIEYFKLGFYDAGNKAGSLMTGITCGADNIYFYVARDKFRGEYAYNKVEITAVGMNGYADATWTGDVEVNHKHPVYAASYTYAAVGTANNPDMPLVNVKLSDSFTGAFAIGIFENGELLTECYSWPNNSDAMTFGIQNTAAAAAIEAGTAKIKVYGMQIGESQQVDGIWQMNVTIFDEVTATTGQPEEPDAPPCDAEVTFSRKNSGKIQMNWSAAAEAPAGTSYRIEVYNGQKWAAVGSFAAVYAEQNGSAMVTGPDLAAGNYSKVRVVGLSRSPSYTETVWFEADCNISITEKQSAASAVFSLAEGSDSQYKVGISGLYYDQNAASGWMELAYQCDVNGGVVDGSTITATTEEKTYTDAHTNLVISTGNYRIREYHNVVAEGNALSFDLYEGEWKKCIENTEEEEASVSFAEEDGMVRISWKAPEEPFTKVDGETYYIEALGSEGWVKILDLKDSYVGVDGESVLFSTAGLLPDTYTKIRFVGKSSAGDENLWFEAGCHVVAAYAASKASAMFIPVTDLTDTYQVEISDLSCTEGSVEITYSSEGQTQLDRWTIDGFNAWETTCAYIADGEYRIREFGDISCKGSDASLTIYEGEWQKCIEAEEEETPEVCEDIWFEVSGTGTYATYYVNWTPVTLASNENYYVNGERLTGSNAYKRLFSGSTLPFDLETMDIVIEKGVYNGERTVLYTAKNAVCTKELAKADFTVVGQENGTYLLKTDSDLTGMNYCMRLTGADGKVYLEKVYAAPSLNVYPWDGSTMEVMAGSFVLSEDTHTLTFTHTPAQTITTFSRANTAENVTVTTVDELKTALLRGGTVTLGADMTTTSSITISGGEPVELVLNGKALETGGLTFENGKQVTIDGTAENSRLTGKLVVNYGPKLLIEGGIYDRISATKMGLVSITDADIANIDKATAVAMYQCGNVELTGCTVHSVTNTALDVGTCDMLIVNGGSYVCSGTGTSNIGMDIDYVDCVTLNGVSASATGSLAARVLYGTTAKISGGSYTTTCATSDYYGTGIFVSSFDSVEVGGTIDENLIVCSPRNGLEVNAEKTLILRDITVSSAEDGYCSGSAVIVGSSSHTESPVVTLTRVNAKGTKALNSGSIDQLTVEYCTFTGDPDSTGSFGMWIGGTTGVSRTTVRSTTATGNESIHLFSQAKGELSDLSLTGAFYASTVDNLNISKCNMNGNVSIVNQSYNTPAEATMEEAVVTGCLYVSGGSVPSVHQSVTISSGSFFMPEDAENAMLYSYDYSDLCIEGGTFTGLESNLKQMFGAAAKGAIEISGGTFNKNPADYVVEGVEVTEENGLWTVGEPAAAPVPTGEAWLCVTENDITLNWTPAPEGYEIYFLEQSMYNTSYSLLYEIRNATPGSHDFVVYISDDWGQTKEEWARLDDALIVTQSGEDPQVSIAGQADGSFRFIPLETDCAGYEFTLFAPDGTQIGWPMWIEPNGTNDMFAAYEGSTFMVNEIGWTSTGDQLDSVEVTVTGKKQVAFTPYDFSNTVVTITENDPYLLTAALRAGGKVILESDVTYTYSEDRSFDSLCCGAPVELDLNGHTITLSEGCSWTIEYGKKITITDSSAEQGGIYGPGYVYVQYNTNGSLETVCHIENRYNSY